MKNSKGKKYESDVLKIAAKKEPAEVLSYCASGKFKETSFGEELILEAMKNAAISSNSASACLTHINLYKERPQMHDTLKKTLLSADVRTVFELYPKFREMPLAMEVVVSAAKVIQQKLFWHSGKIHLRRTWKLRKRSCEYA